MSQNERNSKNGALKVSWGKPTKIGYISDEIKAADLDVLLKAEPGAKIAVRKVMCTNKRTGEQFESAVFELIPAEEVRKFNANKPKQDTPPKGTLKANPHYDDLDI